MIVTSHLVNDSPKKQTHCGNTSLKHSTGAARSVAAKLMEDLMKGLDRHNRSQITNAVNKVTQLDADGTRAFRDNITQQLNRRIKRLEFVVEQQLNDDQIDNERAICQGINFLSTIALIETNISKRNPCYTTTNEQILFQTRIMNRLAKIPFKRLWKEVTKPLGLLFGNVSKKPFTDEQRMGFKPFILRMLSTVTDPTVRYWYLLSLHRIVQEKNVELEELSKFDLYKVMVESVASDTATTEVRYALKVITIFGGELHPSTDCIEKFYQCGLKDHLIKYMETTPKMVFNFLEKMHGQQFRNSFPRELTEYFLSVILDRHPIRQVDHVKAALRIIRYRFEDLRKSASYSQLEIDNTLMRSLGEGLIEKLCIIIETTDDQKERQYAYNVVKELLLLSKERMQVIYPMVASSFITLGLDKFLLDHRDVSHTYKKDWIEIHSMVSEESTREPSWG